jgi:DNA-binding transcriptional MocR family regulator
MFFNSIQSKASEQIAWIGSALSEWHGPTFHRIVHTLAADVASGRLVRGQRLPSYRAMDAAMGIDLTTVMRCVRGSAAARAARREDRIRVGHKVMGYVFPTLMAMGFHTGHLLASSVDGKLAIRI